jgi:hypothetical protein
MGASILATPRREIIHTNGLLGPESQPRNYYASQFINLVKSLSLAGRQKVHRKCKWKDCQGDSDTCSSEVAIGRQCMDDDQTSG